MYFVRAYLRTGIKYIIILVLFYGYKQRYYSIVSLVSKIGFYTFEPLVILEDFFNTPKTAYLFYPKPCVI